MKLKLIVLAAVTALAALLAVGAGAFDADPVAPQLSPQESGVEPGAVPGEVSEFETPDGKAYGEVSPCIDRDPAGYSDAELNDPRWCFHKPGAASGDGPAAGGPAEARKDPHPVGKLYEFRDGRVVQVSPAD